MPVAVKPARIAGGLRAENFQRAIFRQCERPCWSGMARTGAICRGAQPGIRIASGFRRSCCSRRGSRRCWSTIGVFLQRFRRCRRWPGKRGGGAGLVERPGLLPPGAHAAPRGEAGGRGVSGRDAAHCRGPARFAGRRRVHVGGGSEHRIWRAGCRGGRQRGARAGAGRRLVGC